MFGAGRYRQAAKIHQLPVVRSHAASLRQEVVIGRRHALKRRDDEAHADLGSTGEVEDCEIVSVSLSPIGNPAWETIRGVRFAMQYGPSLIEILVTNAALDEIELVPESTYLARFNKHRDAIEKVASGKHQRGQIEESGVVVVQAGDLKPIS